MMRNRPPLSGILRSGGALPGGLSEGLRGGQVLAHLLGGGISLGAELLSGRRALLGGCRAGFGGGGALLSGGADRLYLGLGGGRVGEGIDPLPQPGAVIRSASARSDRSSSAPVILAAVSGLPSSAGLMVVPTCSAASLRRSRHADTRVWPRPAQYSGGRPVALAGAAGCPQPGTCR